MDGVIVEADNVFADAVVDLVELLDISVTPRDPREPYGQVEAGTLTLSGALLPWFSDDDLPERLSDQGLSSRREKDPQWEFTFHHSRFDQDVSFMFDDPSYNPPIEERLSLLPIRERSSVEFAGGSTTVLYGLIILSVGNGSYVRVGTFKTNKEGTKTWVDDMEMRERIHIV